jgi:hypothetical protein
MLKGTDKELSDRLAFIIENQKKRIEAFKAIPLVAEHRLDRHQREQGLIVS